VSLIVDEHREYLSDSARVAAFRQAIREIVTPGSVVLDLASGSGILGLMACEAGASRVYSVEVTGMVEIARAAAAANGYGDRLVGIHGMSTEVVLPERVDAIVCDQVGRFGFEAGILEHGTDARRRFLKSGGVMMPRRVDLFVAPVESPDTFAHVEFWGSRPAGFDFASARRWAVNTGYPVALQEQNFLAEPAQAASLDIMRCGAEPFEIRAAFRIARRGVLHGIGGWFASQLSPSVSISNAPTARSRINRRNAVLPIDQAVMVEPGDDVSVRIHVIPGALVVTWHVQVNRGVASIAKFRHSTLNGMLFAREDLTRMNPRFIPTLTPRGEARRLVLELCDGTRLLEEVEQAVFARHGDLFASAADAQMFVSEVVTGYAR
jgi:Ribosomal protein L11 methyltransferase (PrmA)